MKLLVLALLILYDSMLIFQLEHVKALDTMAPYVWESGDFRAMRLGRDAAGRPFLDYEELAMAMLTENFDLTGKKLSGEPLFFPVRRQKEFERLSDAYRMVFADLSCFPVPESAGGDVVDVVDENGGNSCDFIPYTLAPPFQICYTGTKHIFLIFPAVWRVLFISEDLCFSLIKI